ncbi:hypothetical protein MPSEU_000629600 [Mayamaea pseudoterrestris]|nr:hypothetical protein MPSEU_000629600 [Mayamaea pseudoterrestris]
MTMIDSSNHRNDNHYPFKSDSVAVILAATVGTRLFPMVSPELPKHLLPVAGVSIIKRLLHQIQTAGFVECVIVIAPDDKVTIPALLQQQGGGGELSTMTRCDSKHDSSSSQQLHVSLLLQKSSSSAQVALRIIVYSLEEECLGSAKALACLERAKVVSPRSQIVVLPADAVVLQSNGLSKLAQLGRNNSFAENDDDAASAPSSSGRVACVMLLSDVAQVDEHGLPLKESAKQKKGNLARDEDEIEYIALSQSSSSGSDALRVVWKQPKLEVEQDNDMTSATPKLNLPKLRLQGASKTSVRTDWSDVHVYALSPWVRRLVQERSSLVSLQSDLLPLLVARQFRGVRATFGSAVDAKIVEESMLEDASGAINERVRGAFAATSPANAHDNKSNGFESSNNEYLVLAVVQNAVERVHSIPAYLHATKKVIHQAIVLSSENATASSTTLSPHSRLPDGSTVNAKFSTIFLPGATMGAKVNLKGSVIGANCRIADKCRVNNVIVLDNVVIGENSILQNSVLGADCQIGENCNLNDCQVAAGRVIVAGTKEKGESFTIG